MGERRAPDAIVVGAGVVGAAVAWRLVSGGRRVLVVDETARSGAATRAAGAMLGVLGEVTSDSPSADLNLRLEAVRRYPDWLASVGARAPRLGTFVLGDPARDRELAALAAIEDAAAAHGLRADRVAPGDVPGLATSPGRGPLAAMYLPDEGWVDDPALVDTVLTSAVSTGCAEVVHDVVTHVLHRGDAVRGVRTARYGDLACDLVVLCTGAAVPALIAASGLDAALVPVIMPAKGVSLVLATVNPRPSFDHVLRTPSRQFACGSHILPMGPGRVYIGATNRAGTWQPGARGGATAGEVGSLIRDVTTELATSLRQWSIARTDHSIRPLPVDGVPVAGMTVFTGLAVATGTYRDGMLLAPLLADAVAASVDGEPRPTPVDLSPDRPITEPDGLALARRGLTELVDHWRYSGNSEWPALLDPLLATLARLALDDSDKVRALRVKTLEFLRSHGRTELVPDALLRLMDLAGSPPFREDARTGPKKGGTG